jgi:hypothetical protein
MNILHEFNSQVQLIDGRETSELLYDNRFFDYHEKGAPMSRILALLLLFYLKNYPAAFFHQ